MGLSSGRSSKGKAPADLPSLLEQHLPKRARTLVSPLSDDDREVLTYMLAFGLHLQMLAGVIFPTQKLQQKSSSSAKVGLKREHTFPSQSFSFLSSKSRSRAGKAPLLFAHKTSCSCDCFSCYSSFWSRWAASPNRDLLSTIIEMTEMGDEEEDCRAREGKENTKKQVKKHGLGKGKKCKGEKWKMQGSQETSKSSVSSRPMPKLDDSMSATPTERVVSVSTSKDVSYDAQWEDVHTDEAQIAMLAMGDAVIPMEVDRLRTGSDTKGTGVALTEKTSNIPLFSCGETSPVTPLTQGKTSAVLEIEVVGSCPAQALSAEILQGKINLRKNCTVKLKSNQIMPLDTVGTFIVKEDDEELGQLGGSGEGCLSPRLVCVNTRDRGVLSQVFPHTLCDIASRLWDLVSLGPRSHLMEYY